MNIIKLVLHNFNLTNSYRILYIYFIIELETPLYLRLTVITELKNVDDTPT